MVAELLIYWLIIQVLGLAALPVTAWLLAGLPDRGYAFAKPLGLLLVGWSAWLLAMLGLAPFGAALLALLTLGLALAGWFWLRDTAGMSLRRLLLALLRGRWRLILGYELVFVLALVFVAWMRSYQPDPWGTERPMDFAFFNSIRRGGSFPPQDPWLAGYSINYYYLGYLLMAAVALLSGLEPAITYNLSLALIFALTALGVAGLVLNLIGLSERRGPAALAWLGMLLAVVGVLFAGNQAGAAQVITGSERVVALDGRQLLAALAQGIGGSTTVTLPYPLPLMTDPSEWSTTAAWQRQDMVAGFNWWWPSRALWDDLASDSGVTRRYAITEFPFFSFWLGDMHPHVMSLPFTLLALALALGVVARPTVPSYGEGRASWLELGLVGVVLGGLYAINSWDLPTYLLIFAGALLLRHARADVQPDEQSTELRAGDALLSGAVLRKAGLQLLLVVLAALLLYLPFHLTFRSLVGAKEPLIDIPLLGRLTSTLGLFTDDKTDLGYFFVIFGLFLVPLLAFMLSQHTNIHATESTMLEETEEHLKQPLGSELGIVNRASISRLAWVQANSGLVIVGLTFAVGLLAGFPLLALLPLGVLATWKALQASEVGTSFALWGAAMGCFICFGTEFIYIRDVFEGWQPRFNTIFKFYYQTWLIWGTLTGYALWWLVTHTRRVVAATVVAVTCILLAGGLVYPALTAGKLPREGNRIGLNGKTPRERSDEGRAAIAWLRDNAPAGAVVLEAVGDSYNGDGFGGVSASTGIATIINWPGHQSQWRGGDPELLTQLEPRRAEVQLLYSTPDIELARRLLEQYNVRFVFVGDLERQAYGTDGEAKWSQLGDLVFQQGSITIYKLR